jgi:hypothetical protein
MYGPAASRPNVTLVFSVYVQPESDNEYLQHVENLFFVDGDAVQLTVNHHVHFGTRVVAENRVAEVGARH